MCEVCDKNAEYFLNNKWWCYYDFVALTGFDYRTAQ